MAEISSDIQALAKAAVTRSDDITGGASVEKVQAKPAPLKSPHDLIIGSEVCTASTSAAGVMHCNTTHIALSKLTDYVDDLKKKDGKAPELIVVKFADDKLMMGFETKRIEALSKELDDRHVDKNFPVVISLGTREIDIALDNKKPGGVVLLEAELLANPRASIPITADDISGGVAQAKELQAKQHKQQTI